MPLLLALYSIITALKMRHSTLSWTFQTSTFQSNLKLYKSQHFLTFALWLFTRGWYCSLEYICLYTNRKFPIQYYWSSENRVSFPIAHLDYWRKLQILCQPGTMDQLYHMFKLFKARIIYIMSTDEIKSYDILVHTPRHVNPLLLHWYFIYYYYYFFSSTFFYFLLL